MAKPGRPKKTIEIPKEEPPVEKVSIVDEPEPPVPDGFTRHDGGPEMFFERAMGGAETLLAMSRGLILRSWKEKALENLRKSWPCVPNSTMRDFLDSRDALASEPIHTSNHRRKVLCFLDLLSLMIK